MKKIIAMAASMMLATIGLHAQIGIGIGAGYLNSGRMLCEKGVNRSAGFNGFYASADYSLPLTKELFLCPAVEFSYATGSASVRHDNTSMTSKIDEMYVAVPIDLKYCASITDRLRLFVLAGPMVSYGVMSSDEITVSLMESTLGSTVNCYKDGIYFNGTYEAGSYSPFEFLVEAGGGIEVGRLRLKFAYDYGVLNRYKGAVSDSSIKRNQMKAGVAFVF